ADEKQSCFVCELKPEACAAHRISPISAAFKGQLTGGTGVHPDPRIEVIVTNSAKEISAEPVVAINAVGQHGREHECVRSQLRNRVSFGACCAVAGLRMEINVETANMSRRITLHRERIACGMEMRVLLSRKGITSQSLRL